MLSKKVEQSGKDWDKQLPYVLFAYRTSCQESTKASPFFLLHGRDPKLPTTAALNPPVDRVELNLADYIPNGSCHKNVKCLGICQGCYKKGSKAPENSVQ